MNSSLHSAIVHGMYLFEGATAALTRIRSATTEAVLDDLGGEVGLAAALANFAPIVAELDARCLAADFDYPGVFEYEITETMGQWFVEHPSCTAEEFTAALNELTAAFFGRDLPPSAPVVLTKDEFELAFRRIMEEGGNSYDQSDIEASYRGYAVDPAGHFISQVQP